MSYQRFLLPVALCVAAVALMQFFPVAAAPECGLASGRPYRADSSRGVYYVTDTCTKRPIRNPDVYFSHFTSWSDVTVTSETNLDAVPDDALGFMPWGTRRIFDSGSVIKTVDNNRVYVVLNKNRVYPIGSEEVFGNLRLEWSWVEDVVPEVITAYSMQSIITSTSAYPTGFTFTYNNAPDVFTIVDDGGVGPAKRYIRDMETLRSYYRLDRIAVFPSTHVIRDVSGQEDRGSDLATSTPPGTGNTVQTVSALRSAMRSATPGTTITLAPGTYNLAGERIATTRGGTAQAPITIRGSNARSVIIQTNGAEEAFQVSHPYYTFDNLTIEVGGRGSYHAYKMDTDGHDITIRHNVLVVRRGGEGAIKGSGSGAPPYPDNVLIEHNDISFREPTDHVVAEGIDAIGVKGWVIRNNTIHGIKHASGRTVAWGIMIKGNSQDTLIEQNLLYDTDVAISIGGTSAAQYFRDRDSRYEHRRAIVRNNVSIGSRDVAVYIESGNDTRIYNNTFIQSNAEGGSSSIDVRYAASTADIRNNLLDKPVRNREGGTHTGLANIVMAGQYEMTDFTNISAHDLRPRQGTRLFSAVVDQGAALEQVVNDKESMARPTGQRYDIGAYEEQSASLTAAPTAREMVVEGQLALNRDDASGLPGVYGGNLAAADFDGDGKVDIVMTGNFTTMFHATDNPSGGRDEVRLYRNVSTPGGAIRFTYVATLGEQTGTRGSSVDVGDFNGDGRIDIVAQNKQGSDTASFLNIGNWQFERAVLQKGFGVNGYSLGMKTVDIDLDGRSDVVFNTDGGVMAGLWYRFDTVNNRWEAKQPEFSHRITYGGTIAAGDLNGDRYPEIAVGGNANVPFGSHNCGSGSNPTSGERLQHGQTHLNLGRQNGFALPAMRVVGAFGIRVPEQTRYDVTSCHGMDNAQMVIQDLDNDGTNDVIIAGSNTGTNGPVGMNGQQYDFAVLFNRDGSGLRFEPWEHAGAQEPCGGTTNGGPGNLDVPGVSVGDVTGDGHTDVLVVGHRRDYALKWNAGCVKNNGPQDPYVFDNVLYVNNGNRTFRAISLGDFFPRFGSADRYPGVLSFLSGRPKYVGEGGSVIADFNSDRKLDIILSGATLPYHTNGVNARDYNTETTLATYVLRSTR